MRKTIPVGAKFKKIFSLGNIIDESLYTQLVELDLKVFPGCGYEFRENREWWVLVVESKIIAYCGCCYSEGVCLFVRAWVGKEYRGNGLQRRMIRIRCRAAKKHSTVIVTYIVSSNICSGNNLIREKFFLHTPQYKYAGEEMIYFIKKL